VCLAAVPSKSRAEFVARLLEPLRKLRRSTGRPHWFLVEEAHDLLPASGGDAADGAENTIYVSADPATISPRILAAVDAVAACGPQAGALLDALVAALGEPRCAPVPRAPRQDEALAWFRKSEQGPALVHLGIARKESQAMGEERHEKSAEVGKVLRRA
jgi:hypothetical protein